MRAGLLPHATEGQMEFHVQLLQVQASQLPQLDLLQVLPQPFHRVEVRGVGRQRLQMDPPAGLRHELLRPRPAGGSAIRPRSPAADPDDAAQVEEELDDVQPVQRARPHQRVDLDLRR